MDGEDSQNTSRDQTRVRSRFSSMDPYYTAVVAATGCFVFPLATEGGKREKWNAGDLFISGAGVISGLDEITGWLIKTAIVF